MSHLKLNQAIYKAITNSKFIREYDIKVFFNIAIISNFPYIYLGIANMNNISTKTENLSKITSEINIYTKNTGDNHHLLIIDELTKILTKNNVKMKGLNLIDIRLKNYKVDVKSDGSLINLTSNFISYLEEHKQNDNISWQ